MLGKPVTIRISTRRGLEWSLLLLAILLLCGYYAREFRAVQAQGEAAAVKTTLGALRTALLIDHLHSVVDGTQSRRSPPTNPFLLLDHVPGNYAGVIKSGTGHEQVAGTWVFDAICACIGYAPMYPRDLNTPQDAPALWFRISAAPAPPQIHALQAYVWQGQTLE